MKNQTHFNKRQIEFCLLKNLDPYLSNKLNGLNINDVKAVLKIVKIFPLHHSSSKYTATLDAMIKRINSEPKPKMIYSGIKENSVGIIFGPSKSGKTTYCENLGMCIASNEKQYLGLPIDIENRKVLFISLEEFYTNRIGRNAKQILKLVPQHGMEWINNFIVNDELLPRYLVSDADWQLIEEMVIAVQPGIVFLDSLTHMYQGNIEDSNTAKGVMQKIRELSERTKTTIVVIHHTTKLYDRPLSMDVIAGSRVVAQECDFMIGLNKAMDGKRYIKDVAFRYADADNEFVKTFTIDENLWLNLTGVADEFKLLSVADGRRDDVNKEKLLGFFIEQNESGAKIIPFNVLDDRFIKNTHEMTKPTIYNNLDKLIGEKKIIKLGKGEYQLAAA